MSREHWKMAGVWTQQVTKTDTLNSKAEVNKQQLISSTETRRNAQEFEGPGTWNPTAHQQKSG